jgi:hypothetical protein
MVLVRVRVTSFLCGFATAGALAMYQLRNDLTSSTDFLATQVRACVCFRGGGG